LLGQYRLLGPAHSGELRGIAALVAVHAYAEVDLQ